MSRFFGPIVPGAFGAPGWRTFGWMYVSIHLSAQALTVALSPIMPAAAAVFFCSAFRIASRSVFPYAVYRRPSTLKVTRK